jgi:hypothetical protein
MHALCVCMCVCGLFVTLCGTCNFDADARVRISENTLKKPLTKPSLDEHDQWQLKLVSDWQGQVVLLPAILAAPPYTAVLVDAQTAALLAGVSLAVGSQSSSRRIVCTCFLCGCARRCSPRRIACIRFFGCCARRCSSRRIACTGFFCGCARRCLSRRIACTRF